MYRVRRVGVYRFRQHLHQCAELSGNGRFRYVNGVDAGLYDHGNADHLDHHHFDACTLLVLSGNIGRHMIPQSSIIFAYLLAAFVIMITQRGELPVYLGFILATPKPAGTVADATVPAQQSSPSSNQTSDAESAAVKTAQAVLPFILA